MWPAGLIVGAMFAVFAAIAWTTLARISKSSVRDVFDLAFLLFEGFWVLGWSVAVVILGALTALFLLYRESARLQGARLVHVPRLGPLKILIDYDLADIRDVRVVEGGGANEVLIRFDDGTGSHDLGGAMPRPQAERIVEAIRRAGAGVGRAATPPPAPARPASDKQRQTRTIPPKAAPLSITSPSGLALIGANLVPLGGVLFFEWDLPSVMILYWAESAVIAFYTVLKIAVVGKLAAFLAVPVFVGHFGGFMAMHFLFIYALFIRGTETPGPNPAAGEALLRIFGPLWFSLTTLFLSHGVSFVSNFMARREYSQATVTALMTAPYSRIFVMHVTLLIGGWILMLVKTPAAALALLVVLKTAADFSAHQKEHRNPLLSRAAFPSQR